MVREIVTLTDIEEVDESGNIIKIRKKNFKVKLTINIEHILYVSETFNTKIPRLYKNRCAVYINGIGNVIAKLKYDEAKELMTRQDNIKVRGYGRECK